MQLTVIIWHEMSNAMFFGHLNELASFFVTPVPVLNETHLNLKSKREQLNIITFCNIDRPSFRDIVSCKETPIDSSKKST
jgi:hypothetical protein